MGKRGPNKTPLKLLKLRDSWRAKGRVNAPAPKSEVPRMPTWLTREAKAEWNRVVKQLDALGLITKIDRASLTMLCNSWADYVAAFKDVKKRGTVIELYKHNVFEVNGKDVIKKDLTSIVKNPNIAVMNDAFGRWHKLNREFGLTPGARASLAIEKKPKEDEFAKFKLRKNTS